MNAKQRISEIIQSQPEDASFEELLRELAFELMVERGLADHRKGRLISNEAMKARMDQWQS